jgi:hypothetical protein
MRAFVLFFCLAAFTLLNASAHSQGPPPPPDVTMGAVPGALPSTPPAAPIVVPRPSEVMPPRIGPAPVSPSPPKVSPPPKPDAGK